jgi:hypothetical protein
MMLHSFFQHLPSLAEVLLVVFFAEGGGSIESCGGLSRSGEVVVRPSFGTAERCLWRGRCVAEKQRRAIQFWIPEIASGRTPAAIVCNVVVRSQPQLASGGQEVVI